MAVELGPVPGGLALDAATFQVSASSTAAKSAARLRQDPAGEVVEQPGRRVLLEQLGGHLEELGVAVGQGAVHRAGPTR